MEERKAQQGGHCTNPYTYPPQSPSPLALGTPPPPLLPPTGPITSKGSPRVSGKTLDTSSCPQRPPWKALPTTVALENRGLTWKAMSPASVRKLISNLWARSVLRVRSVAGGSRPRPQVRRKVLTCPLQHPHVPVLSGSSLGPGLLHRRLQTAGKAQGTEPHGLQPPPHSKGAVYSGLLVPTQPTAFTSMLLWVGWSRNLTPIVPLLGV